MGRLMPPSTLGSYAMSGCLLTRHNHTPPRPPNRGTLKRSLQVAGLFGALAASWRMYRYLQAHHCLQAIFKEIETKSGQESIVCLIMFYYGNCILIGSLGGVVTASSESSPDSWGQVRPDLPWYTLADISSHSCKENRIWVTFSHGVYDITEFVEQHPGGEKILMAAGGSLEPFWLLYADVSEGMANMEDPYACEPRRHPALKPSSKKPFNAEPPLPVLVDSFITPAELFYVRNHLPVPEVDPATYELEVDGVGPETFIFSLDDIKKFPKHTITATIQCAGNRRGEMSKVKPVKGLNWGAAAIGNATWSGARLRDVLLATGLRDNQPGVTHVQFEGLDSDPANVSYGASISVEKAMDPCGDTILAYEMNGNPLLRDHGFPIRVVVPGIVGARSVKWLARIIVSGEESCSHWQQNDYKGFCPSVDWDTVDFTKSPAIQELPVTSAICDPIDGSSVELHDGNLMVKGYAWSGGGQKIVRVDVTADGGDTWHVAELIAQEGNTRPGRHWAWTLWRADIPVLAGSSQVEVWAKAIDASYNTQPESFQNIWNLRGVLSNAYHRVKVNIVQS
uniref:Sulfite oxidase n=1 Tax=Timema douglasi TaxID=61478 RepID=A0A7R8VC08_TIMDO|nr:unnamed protein product [Timema douglasi]